jgi:hypothetical protein
VVDLRTQSSVEAEYEVSLCARPSPEGDVPGHAFVLYSVKLRGSDRKVLALGFTTSASTSKTAASYGGWLPVDGFLGEERYTSIKQRCLVVRVDKPAFDAAWKLAHPFAGSVVLENLRFAGVYTLGEKDCMSFMVDVANVLKGVKVPQRGGAELPRQYLRRLIESN